MIGRREFISLLGGGAAVAWPLAALAQQMKVYRIGALVVGNADVDSLATPKRSALHPTCCLGPLRASRVLAPTHVARKNCLQWLAVQQPSNQGGAYAPV
jgi:hypothetical protein